jgi:predicted phage tail protein
MRDIFLHGAPGRTHGRRWRLEVASPGEAVRALIMLCPPLRDVFRKGRWRVIVGSPHIRNGVGGEHLNMNMGGQALHIVPATAPRGDDIAEIGIVVVGVILIAVASVLTYGAATAPGIAGFSAALAGSSTATLGLSYGTVALVGLSLVTSGIVGLLTPNPAAQGQATDQARPDDRPSFFFNGVVNNTQQGGPVPLVFGRHLVGSVVVSGSLSTEQIPG